MPRQFELLTPGFHNGNYCHAGSVVTLRDDERPGQHMKPYVAFVPPAAPLIVPAMAGAPKVVAKAPGPVVNPPGEPAYDQTIAEPKASIAAKLEAAMALVKAAPVSGSAPVAPRHPGFLIFDTETNSLKEPRLAAIGMIFTDRDLNVEFEYSRLIQPDGWTMEAEAGKVNGLTDHQLRERGCRVFEALIAFEIALAWGRTFVAHFTQFDLRVMRGELERERRGSAMVPFPSLCTGLASRRMLGTGKLVDAYEKLMGEPLIGAHDALVDARACLEVLRKLRERGFDIHQPVMDQPK